MTGSWRERLLLAFLCVVILVCVVHVSRISIRWSSASAYEFNPNQPLNTLIVSVCSLRRDLLEDYGHKGPERMPELEKFFRQSSFVFDNFFNGVPWVSILAYLEPHFANLQREGFFPAGPFTDYPFVRIPALKSWTGIEFRDTNDSNWEKNYKSEFEYVRNSLPRHSNRPFTLMVHVKYMHYPLIDYFNSDSEWDFFLDSGEKALLQEYLAHPEVYYKKLPFLLMMTSDPIYAQAHPAVKALYPGQDMETRNRVLGLLTNDRFLQEWKSSAGYETDLGILKKVYLANARYMDSQIFGPLLNLFGDAKLQATTAVLFTGDHGESHMERDKLTHATSAFDEALAVPGALKIPGAKKREHVVDQTHMHTVADLMAEIIRGRATAQNAAQKLQDWKEDAFVMRDCANTLHAVRFRNEFKYVIDLATGTRALYDLKNDPGELRDIASENPDKAAEMEALYWANLPRFKWVHPSRCAPW